MEYLKVAIIVYGIFVLYVAIFKTPFIWNVKKLRIMSKMFGGDTGLQIFLVVWGALAIALASVFL